MKTERQERARQRHSADLVEVNVSCRISHRLHDQCMAAVEFVRTRRPGYTLDEFADEALRRHRKHVVFEQKAER